MTIYLIFTPVQSGAENVQQRWKYAVTTNAVTMFMQQTTSPVSADINVLDNWSIFQPVNR